MQATESNHPTAPINVESVRRRDDGIELSWSDGQRSFVHAIWLRDCCYCSDCGDSSSSKPYLAPSDIPLDSEIRSSDTTAEGELRIVRKADRQVSSCDPPWLRRHCYDDASRQARYQQLLLRVLDA